MSDFIEQHEPEFVKALDHLNEDLKTLRTGRAHPGMIENVIVESYGTPTPLNQLSSISVPEARNLLVQPWDKSLIKEIEKAIVQADLGVSVTSEGERVRVTVPQMTEEKRQEYLKILGQKLENSRIAVRGVRDKVREAIQSAEKSKEITEDDRYAYQKELDDLTNKFNGEIKGIGDAKEKEITTI